MATASMSTPVIEIISLFASKNISAVPVIDENGMLKHSIRVLINSLRLLL
jgi:CBS-domain-containing membrane protein